MTEAQIEAVARLYCRKLGLDPDTLRGVSGWPRWRFYVESARVAASPAMSEAIAEVRATVTEGDCDGGRL